MAISTKYKVAKGSPESLVVFNRIKDQDLPLIQRLELDTVFDPIRNRLDVFFYSLDGRYLASRTDSRNYSVVRGGNKDLDKIDDITLNPEKDSIDGGYPNGDVNILYNFINNLLSDKNTQPKLFIESISPDRTEIRALTNEVTTKNIVRFVDTVKGRLSDNSYFEDFRLNFGRNQLLIGINIGRVQLKNSQAIIIKLYQPLPDSINEKDTFLLEELVGDSVLYEVITEVDQITTEEFFNLRGPNYDIELVEENNNPTGFLNYNDLFSYPVTNSFYEVYSLFNEKGAQISIDHTDFSEFIQFSSAEERLRNFYYKASLLEFYRNKIQARNTFTASLEENISGILNNFDHYDRYLYYETGSFSWPKNSNSRPFILASTGSAKVQTWFNNIILSGSNYDKSNQDRLINSIPSFIREDINNVSYSLFVDMVGQHFDNLWIYSKAVTDKYNADNRLNFGISKDLVRDAIENFGITLYNNNEALNNLFSSFVGESYDTGSEQIKSLIVAVEGSGSLSGSLGNQHLQPVPKTVYQNEVYKRIYHNIPLLLKSKGTERGLRALINSFGIPSDILSIKTFGGSPTDGIDFYGPSSEVTSSLGKIRIANTDTVVTGSTLSNFTTVVNPGIEYSKDLHTVEIGFSPADNLNSFIKSHPSMSAFDIDAYIGDPGLAYSSSYASLGNLAETVFTSGSSYANVYNAFDFIRLIKFFDNSIFRIIKDFVPARSNVDTGIVIKPHILDRSKIKQPEVKWSNQSSPSFVHTGTALDFTGSYYSTNFSIDGEIDTAFVTGSTGLNSIYTSSYTEIYANPSGGYQTLIRSNHNEASFTGEYSGSIIQASSGELNKNNRFKYQPVNTSLLFSGSDFTVIENNINLNRISGTRLKVDQSSYSPYGIYSGSYLPVNYEIISSSIANGVQGLDSRHFAEVQDSSYFATGWKNSRFEGSEASNRRRGVRVLGLEPSVNYDSFTGYRFLDTATTASIRDLVASVDDAAGEDRQDLKVYFNKYESKLLGDVLVEFESVAGRAQGSATLNSSTVNSFGVTVSGVSQGLYNWSGSIGEYIDGGRVVIDFNVTYDFWTDDEISGSLAPISPGSRTPSEFTISLIDLDNGGIGLDSINTLFSDGVFVGKPNGYGDEYNYSFTLKSDVVSKNVAIKFRDDNLYEQSSGTTSVTFNFNTIKKSNFIPVNNPTSGIVASTQDIKTFFYEEVTPTPSSPSGFQTITNSKIYRLDTDEIITTNDLGIVTNIE